MPTDVHRRPADPIAAWREAERAVEAADEVVRVAAQAVESIRSLAEQAGLALKDAQAAAAGARSTLAAAQLEWREAMGATEDRVGTPAPATDNRPELS